MTPTSARKEFTKGYTDDAIALSESEHPAEITADDEKADNDEKHFLNRARKASQVIMSINNAFDGEADFFQDGVEKGAPEYAGNDDSNV